MQRSDVGPKGEKFACRPTDQIMRMKVSFALSLLRICIEEIKQGGPVPAIASSALKQLTDSALSFGELD